MIEFNFAIVLAQWPMLLRGLGLTVALTAVSAVLGVVVGTACAWARLHGGPVLKRAVGAYVELMRNTPFIIQLFFIFFGLPSLGVRLSVEMASVLAMVLNLGAYACEIVRAGLQSTPRGQLEAAMSLALAPWQIFSRVMLPPALARIWPALVSQIIIVMLGSAVCGQISAEELSQAANLISSRTFRSFESYIIVTVLYLLLAVGVRQLLYWVGPRFLFSSR
jgi:polar amino acid transport system permease protein